MKFVRSLFFGVHIIHFLSTFSKMATHNDAKWNFSSCSTFESEIVATYFVQQNLDHSNCPTENWLLEFRSWRPSTKKVLINIGCDTGYNFALWTSIWAPWTQVNPISWYQTLASVGYSNCGYCNNCLKLLPNSTIIAKMPNEMIMIGSKAKNNNLVEKVISIINSRLEKSQKLNIQLIDIGVMYNSQLSTIPSCGLSNHSKIVDNIFQDIFNSNTIQYTANNNNNNAFGDDNSNKKNKNDDNNNNPLLDHSIVHRFPWKVSYVDILAINTKGSDPLVLASAMKTLKQNRIRMLMFEYHPDGAWGKTSLYHWVSVLRSISYVCYFAGNRRLWRLTGRLLLLLLLYWLEVVAVDVAI